MFKKIKYTSDNGTVTLGGGQHSSLRVRSITGLGLMLREYSSAAVSAGQRETGRRDMPRTITIGADLCGNGDDLENFERIVYADGYLELDFGDKQRRIACKLESMSDPEWKIPNKLASFAVQFTCDDPYFEDAEATVEDVAVLTNAVIDSFTLPCVFTTSENMQTFFVAGIKSVYPIIYIGCTEAAEETAEYGIRVSNITTGKAITIYHRMQTHEIVTINLKERTVVSSVSGNIINSLSDDSDMEDLYLIPGKNTLVADNLSNAETNYIQVEYRSEYVAAEY